MNYFKLRTDLSKSSSDAIISYISRISSMYCYVIEGSLGDNPHMHFYLETNSKHTAMRQQLRNLCGKGNGAYSLKSTEEKPIEYLAYMLKEGQITYVNIPQETIEESEKYNAKVKSEINQKKKDKKSMFEKISEYIESRPDEHVINSIIQYHIDNDILVFRSRILSYYDTYCLKNDANYRESFVSQLIRSHY